MSDPWVTQNNWQARERFNETHDLDGNRSLGGPRAPVVDINDPVYWLSQARKAVRLLIEGKECVATTTGRLLMCCEELVRLARDREPPTEAELLAELKHVMGEDA